MYYQRNERERQGREEDNDDVEIEGHIKRLKRKRKVMQQDSK